MWTWDFTVEKLAFALDMLLYTGGTITGALGLCVGRVVQSV
jgi:hypothetical protein